MFNIELKAKTENAEGVREVLKSRKAVFKGVDLQTDTYFKVNNGRLKLREGNIENSLIFYRRENVAGIKKSKIILYKSEPGSNLKSALTESMGILVEVKKEREIYFIENIKFHIDKVEGLGEFIEIEAIDKEETLGEEFLQKQCEEFAGLFKIKDSDYVAESYSDLLIESKKRT